MTAAISAARHNAEKVRLIEKNSEPGRKLLATGNGRCNLTNTDCEGVEEILGFFSELGLLTRVEEEGRVYPYPEQASAVRDALVSELEDRKAEVLCGLEVQTISKKDSCFVITTADGREYRSDALILATGGKAGPQYGSAGDGYRFAKSFGHNVVRPMPSLVQTVSEEPFFKELKGVRAKGQAKLVREGRVVDAETGEIQFTEEGLSGICIFNLSRKYVREDIIRIDLFPEYGEDRLIEIISKRAGMLENRSMSQFLNGMLHKKLIPVVLGMLCLDANRKASGLDLKEVKRIVRFLKGWDIPISGTKGWKEAQVTSGGVDLDEIDLSTMESRLVSGLYFAGELLDFLVFRAERRTVRREA
jgi:predicted Rossmann fold flavoprotein